MRLIQYLVRQLVGLWMWATGWIPPAEWPEWPRIACAVWFGIALIAFLNASLLLAFAAVMLCMICWQDVQ